MSHNQKKKDENIEHFKIGKAKGEAAVFALLAMIFFVLFIAIVLYIKIKGYKVFGGLMGIFAIVCLVSTMIWSFLTIMYH